ncbi:hypothetical protein FACS1894201_03020 [Bacteroidia bacterium]|nr:hypothetical protein FACS1894201_03020 [Bacteroidia bacterium]
MIRTCPICKCVIENADFCPYCLGDFRTCVDNSYQQALLQYAERRKKKNTEKQQVVANYESVNSNYKIAEKQKEDRNKEKKQLSYHIIGKYTGHNQNNETLLCNERYNKLSKNEEEYKKQEKLKKDITEKKKYIETFETERTRFKELYKGVRNHRNRDFIEAESRAKKKVGGDTKYKNIVNKYTK